MTQPPEPEIRPSQGKLCFGGSFNPLHLGHLLVARAVAEEKNFSQVVLIPSAQPPHKQPSAELAAAGDRLEMCRLVSENDPLFTTNDLELRRNAPSFTLETARQLKRSGWTEVNWLIGADMLNFLPKWHQPLNLLREVRFWIVQRPGHQIDWSQLSAEYQALRQQVITTPLIQISASDIRRRVRQGRPVRYMVPPEVERYIVEHNLYKG